LTRTFCKANAPAAFASRPLHAPAKPSASEFAHDELSVFSVQFKEEKCRSSKSRCREQEIINHCIVYVHFSCS
jgi:hypothetical protein